jgi:hypothetical protein
MLVQQRGTGLPPQHPARPGRFLVLRLDQGRVQTEQRGEMVRVGRYGQPQRVPEPGYPVGGLTAQHALGAQVDRGERDQLHDERFGPHRTVRLGQFEQAGQPGVRRARRLGEHAEGAEQLGTAVSQRRRAHR